MAEQSECRGEGHKGSVKKEVVERYDHPRLEIRRAHWKSLWFI